MPRRRVGKGKKETIKSEESVPDGISSIENNDLMVENDHIAKDTNIDVKREKDMSKQGRKKLENGSAVVMDDIEVKSENVPKQKERNVSKNKDIENNHIGNIPEIIAENNTKQKTVLGKRGRKKVNNENESHSVDNNCVEVIETKESENNHIKEVNVNKTETIFEKSNIEEKIIRQNRGKKKNNSNENLSGENNYGKHSVEVNSEMSSENPAKQKKVGKNKESENIHDERNVNKSVAGKDILEEKVTVSKRGRKKVNKNDAHSVAAEQMHLDKQLAKKQKKDVEENNVVSSLKDSKISDAVKDKLSVISKEKDLTDADDGIESKLDKALNSEKIDSSKKKGLMMQDSNENVESLNTHVTKVSSRNAERTIPKKRGRKPKNEVLKPEEETYNKTRQPKDVNENELKEVRVLIKRNKQTEKAVQVSKESHFEETSNKGKKKNADAPSDGGNENTKGRKRKLDDGDKDSKKSKSAKESAKSKSSSKEKIPDVTALDFSNTSTSPTGKCWSLKLSSWNVNGIRAWLDKNGLSYLHHEKPDILCIQETKCSEDKLPEEVKNIEGYHTYWLAGDKDGYSGVGLISKEKPINIEYGIAVQVHDNEGRVITAEYDKFYLVSVYVPNAGRGLVRLDYRMQWDKDFRAYLKKLDNKKPVILCGDLNVAHEEIDLANPKTNKKNAGFTNEEREGFSTLLAEGFIDTFRQLYPDTKGAYTFWTYMMNARAKNVGWRLDYFVVSERFVENICDSVIRKDVFGSDHCPITLFLSV